MATPFVYVGTWTIKEGKIEEARRFLSEHADFVEANEPRMIAFHMYLDEEGRSCSVVQVHPDSTSMEFHMQLLAEHMAGAMDLIDTIVTEQYFGPMSDDLAKTLASWETPEVTVIKLPDHVAGFTRSSIR
jgi:quinol monooxygenase YgiN